MPHQYSRGQARSPGVTKREGFLVQCVLQCKAPRATHRQFSLAAYGVRLSVVSTVKGLVTLSISHSGAAGVCSEGPGSGMNHSPTTRFRTIEGWRAGSVRLTVAAFAVPNGGGQMTRPLRGEGSCARPSWRASVAMDARG